MRKKIIIASLIAVVLMVSTIAAVTPTFAASNEPANVLKNFGTGSMVYLNSPPTTLSRPSIQLRCFDFNKDSAFGEADGILVYVFSQTAGTYVIAAFITDNPNPDYLKALWAGTNIWKPSSGLENVIQLQPSELEIYTDSTTSNGNGNRDTSGSNNDMLIVTLTKAVTVKKSDSTTFDIPIMTLKFRPIAESYYDSGANAKLPSLYYRQPISNMRTPAWVEESVPSWFGAVSPQEVCGHIDYKYIEAITPPTPPAT